MSDPSESVDTGGIPTSESIQREILAATYIAAFKEEWLTISELAEASDRAPSDVDKAADRLVYYGLIERITWHAVDITVQGILTCEREGIVCGACPEDNSRIRVNALRFVRDVYNSGGRSRPVDHREIAATLSCSEHLAIRNLNVLEGLGLLSSEGYFYSITPVGLDRLGQIDGYEELGREFERISEMAPQSRGVAFEQYLGRILSEHGWRPDLNVKTLGEQVDLVLHRDREIYIAEVKWWSEPIEAKHLRDLQVKLSSRADTRGLFFSMSGFTDGAEQVCREALPQRVIMLMFGPVDIRGLISRSVSFDDILNERFQDLVIRKRVVWK